MVEVSHTRRFVPTIAAVRRAVSVRRPNGVLAALAFERYVALMVCWLRWHHTSGRVREARPLLNTNTKPTQAALGHCKRAD